MRMRTLGGWRGGYSCRVFLQNAHVCFSMNVKNVFVYVCMHARMFSREEEE